MSINFEVKTDRELLVLIAQTTNDQTDHLAKLNNKINEHDNRIYKLEKQQRKRWAINWTALSLIASVVALIVVSLGTRVGWW